MNIRRFSTLLIALFLALGLTACGSAEGDGNADASADGATITIQPVGNEMKFARTEFTVEAGEQVRLVFENTATSEAMQHNIVILSTTDEAAVQRVGQAALQAGPSQEYVPEDEAILAYTPMAAPGETVQVTFTAPSEPGTYRYICTFPGHYMVMQGTMTVTA